MNEHTYWNSNGPEQAKYDEMEAAAFKYTKATLAIFRAYFSFSESSNRLMLMRDAVSAVFRIPLSKSA